MQFTVYTPTFNRCGLLQRVYASLHAQTFKEFQWLIIDDGSDDGTNLQVERWIQEGVIEIKYVWKPNGGKHTAMSLAHKMIKTKYIVQLDSDDTLTPNAISSFAEQWQRIEQEGLSNEIAEIRALAAYEDGTIVGGSDRPFKGAESLDLYYHQWYLKRGCHHEMIMSWNTELLNDCLDIDRYDWHSDQIKYISEGVFWSALGRKYKTRFLNQILRIYFVDSENSISKISGAQSLSVYYSKLVSSVYYLNENLCFLRWRPHKVIWMLCYIALNSLRVKEDPRNVWRRMSTFPLKLGYMLSYPFVSLLYQLRYPNFR